MLSSPSSALGWREGPAKKGIETLTALAFLSFAFFGWREGPAKKGIETESHLRPLASLQYRWREGPAEKGIETTTCRRTIFLIVTCNADAGFGRCYRDSSSDLGVCC